MACLSYLDYFSLDMRRVALRTAANICRQLPATDCWDLVADSVPVLTNLLVHDDSQLVESACSCLTLMAATFSALPHRLQALCAHGLIPNAMRLIAPATVAAAAGAAAVRTSTHDGLIRLIVTCCPSYADVAEQLHATGGRRASRRWASTLLRLDLDARGATSAAPAVATATAAGGGAEGGSGGGAGGSGSVSRRRGAATTATVAVAVVATAQAAALRAARKAGPHTTSCFRDYLHTFRPSRGPRRKPGASSCKLPRLSLCRPSLEFLFQLNLKPFFPEST